MSNHIHQEPAQLDQTQPATQAAPCNPDIPDSHHQLFDYQHMEWELDQIPDPNLYPPTQLFHLYAVSGHLFIGVWSAHYQMAADAHPHHMHIVGWAPLANEYPVQ